LTDPVPARLRRLAALGAALYAAAAGADAWLTWSGLRGSPGLEGNPFLRGTMERAGVVPALVVEKAAVGAAFWLLAVRVGAAIHRDDPWVRRVPMTPPVRRWMRAGDRWWTALAPLYGVALAQAVAAGLWLTLR
jgi:hypothetical protein